MPTAATDFQVVLNVVKEWYMQSLRDLLVSGQWAIEDADRQLIRYVTAYCSKAQLEWQLRGSMHSHYLVWQQRDEDQQM
jgi:hypothetical protein